MLWRLGTDRSSRGFKRQSDCNLKPDKCSEWTIAEIFSEVVSTESHEVEDAADDP
jgi:hypothetical protein